jgi:hypothetical protein
LEWWKTGILELWHNGSEGRFFDVAKDVPIRSLRVSSCYVARLRRVARRLATVGDGHTRGRFFVVGRPSLSLSKGACVFSHRLPAESLPSLSSFSGAESMACPTIPGRGRPGSISAEERLDRDISPYHSIPIHSPLVRVLCGKTKSDYEYEKKYDYEAGDGHNPAGEVTRPRL